MNTWYLVLAGVWVWCSTFRVWVRTWDIPLNAFHCSNGISCDGAGEQELFEYRSEPGLAPSELLLMQTTGVGPWTAQAWLVR